MSIGCSRGRRQGEAEELHEGGRSWQAGLSVSLLSVVAVHAGRGVDTLAVTASEPTVERRVD